MKKQFGFRPELDILKDEDYVFGGFSGLTDDITLESGDSWANYLSIGEHQATKHFDPYACVSLSALNCIEAILNYKKTKGLLNKAFIKWCEDKGYFNDLGQFDFSDRYIAKLSGTDLKNGNSGAVVADTMRNYGLIPEKMYPSNRDMSRAEYYKTITADLIELGKEWNEWVEIKYERVFCNTVSMKDALVHSPLQVYVYAWENPINGVYQATNKTPNHAISEFMPEWFIFDSYTEDELWGKDFIKQLASNFKFYTFGYKYQVLIKKKDMPEKFVKIVKKNESNEHGLYIPVISADVLKQLSNMFDIDIPLKSNGSVDWEKVKVDGEVAMYASSQDYVEAKGTFWDWFKKFMGL